MKVHHIGYLVKHIDKAVEEFCKLGWQPSSEMIRDELRQVTIIFLQNDGNVVELVSPYCAESVVMGLLKRFKNSPYHICYESNNLEKDISKFSEKGYSLMGDPKEAPAIEGNKVVFLMNRHIGIIELLEVS